MTANIRNIKYYAIMCVCFIPFFVHASSAEKEKHSCTFTKRSTLMREYPELRPYWEEQMKYMRSRSIEEKEEEAKLEKQFESGEITKKQYHDRKYVIAKTTIANMRKLQNQFHEKCIQLTGVE